jgi:hypothetical protein
MKFTPFLMTDFYRINLFEHCCDMAGIVNPLHCSKICIMKLPLLLIWNYP